MEIKIFEYVNQGSDTKIFVCILVSRHNWIRKVLSPVTKINYGMFLSFRASYSEGVLSVSLMCSSILIWLIYIS